MAKVYGPFRINDGDEFVHIRKNREHEYIRLYAANGEITDEEMALAYRIAAVDELLEACKEMIDSFVDCFPPTDEISIALRNTDAAIAKAEGKS